MSERRRALGRGLGALIPSGPGVGGATGRPVDVFFPDQRNRAEEDTPTQESEETQEPDQGKPAADRPGSDSGSGTVAPVGAGTPDTDSSADHHPTTGSEHGFDGAAPSPSAAAAASTQTASRDRAGVSDARGNGERADDGLGPDVAPAPHEQAPPRSDHGDGETELVAVPGATFAEIALKSIQPNAQQPRQIFDEDELEELASSIREVGVLQPIVVRSAGTGPDGAARYELIMGERRWRASELAGNTTVPAIIRDTAESDMLRDALLENLHRAQLNPLEEAAAYQQLLDDFDCTHDDLATRIARSRPQISNTLRLLKLPPLVQRRVAAGVLSAGHARALLGLPDGAAMERLAQRIVAEGLSVRATEELVTLGEEPMQPEMRRRPRAGQHSPALNDLAGRLSDKLDTKVKVNLGQRKGRINIEFASVQDLNRILGVLAPQDPGVFQSATSPLDDDEPGFSSGP